MHATRGKKSRPNNLWKRPAQFVAAAILIAVVILIAGSLSKPKDIGTLNDNTKFIPPTTLTNIKYLADFNMPSSSQFAKGIAIAFRCPVIKGVSEDTDTKAVQDLLDGVGYKEPWDKLALQVDNPAGDPTAPPAVINGIGVHRLSKAQLNKLDRLAGQVADCPPPRS